MEDDRDRDRDRSHSCLSLSGKIIHTSASSLSSILPVAMTESSQANIDFSLPSSLNSKSSFSLDDTIEEEEDYFEPEARQTSTEKIISLYIALIVPTPNAHEL